MIKLKNYQIENKLKKYQKESLSNKEKRFSMKKSCWFEIVGKTWFAEVQILRGMVGTEKLVQKKNVVKKLLFF